ncbi:MAG: hypothetical protein NTY13_04415 [Chlamydiae bacterium]|nr:hypothetical protein [Chlamydiota bacterium]
MKKLLSLLVFASSLLAHDLHYHVITGSSKSTLICLHGYGDNYTLGIRLKEKASLSDTVISFNLPDHDIKENDDHINSVFGTPAEILPALDILKKCIIEEGRSPITLYGMSAGGGVLINILSLVYGNQPIPFSLEDRQKIRKELENGVIILDVPFRSLDEIIAHRGASTPELTLVSKRYHKNNMSPIEVLQTLHELRLNIIVYIAKPDEVISNRDDELFIKRLKEANSLGTTTVIYGENGGHGGCHLQLWNYYKTRLS